MERNPSVADTGFVVALLNRSDTMHNIVTKIYIQQTEILLPQTVLAEIAYLVGKNAGVKTVVAFLQGLSASRFTLVALTDKDIMRVGEILNEYADSRIDFVDASVMAIAERYGIIQILTLDQRDFRLFRPKHCKNFDIIP
ncbi:type II toxin-antitoxin system VapC family toxin [Nodularia sp. UHCC 0506]|uniref:type II toxin-antitoxin system VapC family toxin n=1 Tax=Nodularia sp. UHCC 0506 TaxID=3110243 RepID=UPI002B21F4B1|nr:PIN domain-containing protein [Nodularia sp. UHCC 0506]MEA5513461.1 PIN domain-containing protein [Nodularia sp. UHCC 0506]